MTALLLALALLGMPMTPGLGVPFYDSAENTVESTDPAQGEGGIDGDGYTQDDNDEDDEDPTP